MSIVIWLVEINILFYSILFYSILFYSILFYCASSVQNPDFEKPAPVVTFSALVSAVANKFA
jgi:hypothetical protein